MAWARAARLGTMGGPGFRLRSIRATASLLRAFLLDAPNVDRVDDVARVGIDRDLPARTLPLHALDGADEAVAIGLAAGLLQGLVDEAHAVVAADREEVRVAFELGIECGDELLVHGGIVGEVVMEGRDDADRGVAHRLERALFRELA